MSNIGSIIASLGIPAMLVALGLGVFGVWRGKKWLPVIAAALVTPFSVYMIGSTDFGWLSLLLPLSLLGAAFAIHREIRWLAWVLLLPLLGVLLLFVVAVVIWANMGR